MAGVGELTFERQAERSQRKSPAIFKSPEVVFAILALVLGLVMGILLPTGGGFDEGAHLSRAVEISARAVIPNSLLSTHALVPLVFREVSYRNKTLNSPVNPNFFKNYINRKIDWNDTYWTSTYSVYFPLLYAPQAAILFLARHLDFSVLVTYYLCRLAELLGYLLLCFFAIRLIPFGKWVMAVLALSPIALQQAVTISTDPYTNGAVFLFLGWVLHLAFQETRITRKQTGTTLLVVLLLFSAKLPAAVLILLLLVLLPRRKFESARSYYLLLAGTAVLFLVFVIAYNGYISLSFRTDRANRGIWLQASYILSHPLQFIAIFFSDIFENWKVYLQQWIAVYPNFLGVVPPAVYPLYGGLLLVTWLTDTSKRSIPRKVRWALLGSFVVAYVSTVVLFYMGGRGIGEGIDLNGRYLIPVMPPLFLGLTLTRPLPLLRRLSPGVSSAAAILTAVPVFMVGLYLTFYVTCGNFYYTPGLCLLPNYRNKETTVAFTGPVDHTVTVRQDFKAECDTIQSIQVWSIAPQSPSSQSTTFLVRDTGTGQVLAQNTLPNSAAPDQGWFNIPISTITGATSRSLAIEIASDNPDSNRALNFSISAKHEYFDGQLYINGKQKDNDLYFLYGCNIHK